LYASIGEITRTIIPYNIPLIDKKISKKEAGKIMSYCMYLRKSRADIEAETRGEGETLARHESLLWDLAKRLNLRVTQQAVYREVVSGETIASRPVMQHVLTEVEQGIWKGVLVVEVERLARGDTMDQGLVAQTFKYSNTKIITPMKIYDPANEFDEEYFEFGLFMSRREYKTINRRLQQGRLTSAKEGKYVGNIPPYGYVRKKLVGEKGFTLEPHPDQAPVVQMIYNLYVKGIGMASIATKLNKSANTNCKGEGTGCNLVSGVFCPIRFIRVKYAGIFAHMVKKMVDGKPAKERPRANSSDWQIIDGRHEAIVDQDVFDRAQIIISEIPSAPAPKSLGIKNPLASIIVCGKCGRKMVRRPHGDRYPDNNHMPLTHHAEMSDLWLDLVENKLLQALESWLDTYRVRIKSEEEKGPETNVLEQSLEPSCKRGGNTRKAKKQVTWTC
jgi:site-specific DNA recombinase